MLLNLFLSLLFCLDLHLRRLQQGVYITVLPLVLVPLAARAAISSPHQVRSDHIVSALEFHTGMMSRIFVDHGRSDEPGCMANW